VTAALPLDAPAPPPVRDAVRLLVARGGRPLVHTRFAALADHLRPGDLLAVNASATLPAALQARRAGGAALDLHLSTPEPPAGSALPELPAGGATPEPPAGSAPPELPAGGATAESRRGRPPAAGRRWIVELRRAGKRVRDARAGERLALPGGATATLVAPYLSPGRLWIAELDLPAPLLAYLGRHGAPIRYAHQPEPRPLADHQTIFAREPGSAESPSAGRPFSPRVLAALRARGIRVASLVLHTGVSSLERGERPYPERYHVPAATAAQVNAARRVIAVGTTVTRALETAAAADGRVRPAAGWTSLVITPERGVRVVDGLITGWHEPDASHLMLLEAVAGPALVRRSYAAAAAHGYRRHEFGDSHLLLP
jgi:S-adenosylmethionine:tRNA ribosyltransferase-isomerase